MKCIKTGAIALSIALMVGVAGCGGTQNAGQQAIAVNTYKITTEDTHVTDRFTGTIVARNDVPVRARVTGYVVEKYVQDGQQVAAGDPLFRIDGRSYEASLAAAQANAAQANATAQNAQVDLERYRILVAQNAIARQTYDTQRANAEAYQQAYEAAEAQVKIASDNVGDTVITAPFSGTLGLDSVDLGTFVTAGSTALVTLKSGNPVLVEFSVSESEYLSISKTSGDGLGGLKELTLTLSDGTIYPYKARVTQVSKSLDTGSGKVIIKAEVNNPDNLLLPGMFVTVESQGKEIKNAILVPTRSILQVLSKDFIFVVDADNKVKQVPITKTSTQGLYTVITGDLKAGDQVIVDGLTKAKPGAVVNPTELTKAQISKEK